MKDIAKKHFLKFLAGFIVLISIGIVGVLVTTLYEVNQDGIVSTVGIL